MNKVESMNRTITFKAAALGFSVISSAPVLAGSLAEERCTGMFNRLISDAGTIKANDIVLARQMRLACLTLMQVVNSDNPEIQQWFCAEEAAQAREACKIADAVIETYESKKSTRINPR
jgi:hypothetical protein